MDIKWISNGYKKKRKKKIKNFCEKKYSTRYVKHKVKFLEYWQEKHCSSSMPQLNLKQFQTGIKSPGPPHFLNFSFKNFSIIVILQ